MSSKGYEEAKQRFEQGEIIKYVDEIPAPNLLDLIEFMKEYEEAIAKDEHSEESNIAFFLWEKFKIVLIFNVIRNCDSYRIRPDKKYFIFLSKIEREELLTTELFDLLKKTEDERRTKFPCYDSWSLACRKRSMMNFNDLREIVNAYLIIKNHEMYKPS